MIAEAGEGKSQGNIYARPDLIGRLIEFDGDHFTVDFTRLLVDPKQLCIAMECSDKFGNYGIIGFARVDESGADPVVTDFVMSCRVAKKFVERTFYAWLGAHEKKAGRTKLLARFVAFYASDLFNAHWGEQVNIGPGNLFEISMLCQGLGEAEPQKVWQPFFDWITAAPADFT